MYQRVISSFYRFYLFDSLIDEKCKERYNLLTVCEKFFFFFLIIKDLRDDHREIIILPSRGKVSSIPFANETRRDRSNSGNPFLKQIYKTLSLD